MIIKSVASCPRCKGDFMDYKIISVDEREKLYNEVWAESVTTVAKRYEMYDTGLRKYCNRLGIPLLPRSPIFKFSADVRKVIYTTNAIECLNSTYRRLNRQRSVCPSDISLLKALYLATFEVTKNGVYHLETGAKFMENCR